MSIITMDPRLSALILLVALLPTSFQKDTVKITVFYESYCPDSIKFFQSQLGPAWKTFHDALDLDLVPYGFASQKYKDAHWHFTCQHVEKECIGNILHTCAIYKLLTSSHLQQTTKLINFINCVMKTSDQYKSANECCKKNTIKCKSINLCQNTTLGENLESGYGNRTNNFKPKIEWIPTAVFNDVFNQTDQDKAMVDLPSVICKYIPNNKHCSNQLKDSVQNLTN